MPFLYELQHQFINAILHESDERLNIYKNNFFITLTSVLKKIYRSIFILIGEEAFTLAAREYIQLHPSYKRKNLYEKPVFLH